MEDRTSDASVSVQPPNRFRKAVNKRDRSCVLSAELAINSTACHLPHSKGNDVGFYQVSVAMFSHWISNYAEYRGGPKDINSIDDPRNGLLLFDSFPKPLGRAEVGFLKARCLNLFSIIPPVNRIW
jgi:hypothetical protein